MLRIAMWYCSNLGRHDGNPLYVWVCLKRMQEKGILEVDHLEPIPDEKLIKPWGKYDLNIWVDWGEDGLKGVLPYEPLYPPDHPLIYWASDTHLGYDYRLNCSKQADLVFCAQKRAVEEFSKEGIEAIWLPHAVEPLAYPKLTLASKKYDICFVGHINSGNRIDFLDRMFKEFPNFFYGQRLFEDAAKKYCETKVVLNISHKDDINMRCFEVMGTGSFLLTNWVPTIGDLFEDGKHLVTYKTFDEAVEKCHYYLEHEEERETIAKAGYEEIIKYHTIDHRVQKILDEVKNYGLISKEELCTVQA